MIVDIVVDVLAWKGHMRNVMDYFVVCIKIGPFLCVVQDQPEFWITKQEYEEEGFNCLRKCGQA